MTKRLDFLTFNQVKDLLQVSRPTLERWIRKGLLRAYRPRGIVSRIRRFRPQDVEDLLQRR